jgi:hypothetical protein
MGTLRERPVDEIFAAYDRKTSVIIRTLIELINIVIFTTSAGKIS